MPPHIAALQAYAYPRWSITNTLPVDSTHERRFVCELARLGEWAINKNMATWGKPLLRTQVPNTRAEPVRIHRVAGQGREIGQVGGGRRSGRSRRR